jgi:glucose-6-phosphate 1-dehydrogenase
VIQNHILQVLSMIAMEPPATPGEQDLRDRKVDALRAIQPLRRAGITRRTRAVLATAPAGSQGHPRAAGVPLQRMPTRTASSPNE